MGFSLAPLSELANFIRVRRQKMGLTMEKFADELGVTMVVVQRLEMGPKRIPDLSLFHRICEVLDCKPEDLLRAGGFLP